MAQKVPAIAGLAPWLAYDTHIAQRVQYIVAMALRTHADASQAELTRVLQQGLRGLGVSLATRQVQRLAEALALLPRAPRRRR